MFLMFQVMLLGGTGKRVEAAGQGRRPSKVEICSISFASRGFHLTPQGNSEV